MSTIIFTFRRLSVLLRKSSHASNAVFCPTFTQLRPYTPGTIYCLLPSVVLCYTCDANAIATGTIYELFAFPQLLPLHADFSLFIYFTYRPNNTCTEYVLCFVLYPTQKWAYVFESFGSLCRQSCEFCSQTNYNSIHNNNDGDW